MHYARALLAATLLALAPACTQAPTHSAAGVDARLDGGHMIGSGHEDSGPTVPPVDGDGYTTADADNPVATDTTGRGGHTLGSGH